jgi:hypothetical protein
LRLFISGRPGNDPEPNCEYNCHDTRTRHHNPAGKALFQMLAVFAEFEHAMMVLVLLLRVHFDLMRDEPIQAEAGQIGLIPSATGGSRKKQLA